MFFQPLTQILPKEMFKNSDSLTFWLFIAAVIHAIVLMGIRFDDPPRVNGKTIEVTIVNSAAKKAPENAKYFAQNNQIAAGLEDQKPMPVAKKDPSDGSDSKKQLETTAAEPETLIQHRLITQKNTAKKLASAEQQQETQAQGESAQTQPELSMEELDKQIAQLGAKVEHLKESSEKTRIKSIDAISAHQYVAAQYIKDWERKVERMGNLNYPAEINGKQDFSGSLVMDVGINTDGTIYNIRIVNSSGISALDKAAEQIVRISAPFSILPESITEELDVLRIRRVWSFSDERNLFTFEQ